mmetsp:Transcript_20607/g.37287  ORF Transcript_20607/g.37287 Transcript_20607/m.37287 type:complete len:98 (+) Transcript_20607:138-431(+)
MTNNWLAVVGVQMMGVKAKLDQALQTANARISNDSENDTRAPVDEERESERERKRQELDQSYVKFASKATFDDLIARRLIIFVYHTYLHQPPRTGLS